MTDDPGDNEEKKCSRLAGPSSRKKKFTKAEDSKLILLVQEFGTKDWKSISKQMIPRSARQCRERWTNYVNPTLSQEPWSQDEDMFLIDKHRELGNHWKLIERYFPGRSKNNIKHRWSMLKELIRPAPPRSQSNVIPTSHHITPISLNSAITSSVSIPQTQQQYKNSSNTTNLFINDEKMTLASNTSSTTTTAASNTLTPSATQQNFIAIPSANPNYMSTFDQSRLRFQQSQNYVQMQLRQQQQYQQQYQQQQIQQQIQQFQQYNQPLYLPSTDESNEVAESNSPSRQNATNSPLSPTFTTSNTLSSIDITTIGQPISTCDDILMERQSENEVIEGNAPTTNTLDPFHFFDRILDTHEMYINDIDHNEIWAYPEESYF